MGREHGMLHLIALQHKGVGGVVIQMDHQPAALITSGAGGFDLWMLGRHPRLLQKMAHPQHSIRIQIWMVHAFAHFKPGFLAPWEANLQAPSIQGRDLCTKGVEESFNLRGP